MVFYHRGIPLFISSFEMKKFFIKILIFLCPLVIGTLWLEHGLSKVINKLSKKRSDLEARADSVKVLVLGTSEALRGINPNYFSLEGYNMANDGQSLFFDKEITLKFFDKLTSLKYVFITVSYFSLWHQVNDDDAIGYYLFWNIRYPDLSPFNIRLYSKILFYNNQNAWGYALKNFKVDSAVGMSDGWLGYTTDMPITDSFAIKRLAVMNNIFIKNEDFSANCQYLHELVGVLTKRHIKAVFIIPPFTSVFMKYADKKRFDNTDSVLKSISTIYRCSYINYLGDKRFTNADFRDVDHLNLQGSKKFSKILNTEILMDSVPKDDSVR
jgi:hypothetical protein